MKHIKLFSIVLIIGLLVFGLAAFAFGQDYPGKANSDEIGNPAGSSAVFLHIGSPLILSDDNVSFLDPQDYGVAVTLIGDRTLLPLRSLAEYFGAEVSYDETRKQAVILYDGRKYTFTIGQKLYESIEGDKTTTVEMDTKALVINDRTMLPLRVIAENILHKSVSYYDEVIAISDDPISLENNKQLIDKVKLKIANALKAKSEKQLENIMSADHNKQIYMDYGVLPVRESAMNEAAVSQAEDSANAAGSDGASGSSSGTDYSSTNTQVSGIDEADIVKTDGRYLFISGNNAVRIIKTNSGEMEDSAIIKLPDDKSVHEIFVDGNRLVLLGTRTEYENRPQPYSYTETDAPATDVRSVEKAEGIAVEPVMDAGFISPYYYKTYSFVDIYDITDPEEPRYVKSHEMEGYYQTSRKSGKYVYMVTNTNVYGNIIFPMMRDTTVNRELYPVALDDIMVMPDCYVPGYVVLSAIDTENDIKVQVEAVTASGHQVYMSESALYLAAGTNDGTTSITKFKIDGMNIGYAGTGKIKGYLLNQFSMDEYNGYLRVASTTWENENALYILDDSLNVTGSVEGLAKDERIYSVRFMGDRGYIVTFRNIDPLFVFDLSDPQNPAVTGELKIPGFSNYLHPVDDYLILGIGAETREIYEKDSFGNEIVIGSRQGGIKLSLFDVSDMGKPREIAKYIIGDSGSYSEAFYNHKAVMVDSASEQVVFDAYIASAKNWNESKQGALVISFGNKDLKLRGVLNYQQPEVYGKYIPYGRRAVYIGDVLYYIQDGIIQAYNYNTLNKIGTLMLK